MSFGKNLAKNYDRLRRDAEDFFAIEKKTDGTTARENSDARAGAACEANSVKADISAGEKSAAKAKRDGADYLSGASALFGLVCHYRLSKKGGDDIDNLLYRAGANLVEYAQNSGDAIVQSLLAVALSEYEIAVNSVIARDLLIKLKVCVGRSAEKLLCGDFGKDGLNFAALKALSVFAFSDTDGNEAKTTALAAEKFFGFTDGENAADSVAACMALSGAVDFAAAEKSVTLTEKAGALAIGIFSRCLSLNYECGTALFGENVKTSPFATSCFFSAAAALSKAAEREKYAPLARRTWFNGMQFCLRENGAAGGNSFAHSAKPYLSVYDYEEKTGACAWAQAALAYGSDTGLFDGADDGAIGKDKAGRFFTGDKMYARDESGFFGKDLIEIPSAASFDRETGEQLRFLLVF